MAPTKKKRKPITNPARGFATTSVASKPKAVKDPEGTESLSAPPSTKSLDSVLASTSSNDDITKPTPTVETSKLSPEEYAKYLETGELQQLVEKYATKVKRDVARQVLRLQSDRRVLRGQAESLNIRRWLSKEITDEIIGIIRDEWGRERAGEGYVNTVAKKPAGEEESSVRLWTLKLVLAELGVSAEGGEGVLKVLVESELAVGTGKDAVWGLDEALEWLALYHGKDELENYEFKPVKTALRVEGSAPAELLIDKPDISSTSHPDSDNEEELGSFSDISDVASDAEPGQLLSTYLRTRLDIYKLDPKAITSSTPRSKSGNPKGVVKQEKPMPRVRKLLQKMQKIESDILFDQRDADNQWALMKINWDKEAACQRKEEHLARKQAVSQEEETLINFNAQNHAAEVSRQADEAAANLFEGEDDDDIGLLGDLFTSLPQNETNETTGASQMVIQDSSGVKMMIQDFGKWTGVGPRRVLEEACRARDPGVKLTYKLISSTSFSNRYALVINWSKDQDLPEQPPISAILCTSSPRSVTVSMFSISTPDTIQSEAYIATAALFLIFSASKREEKVYLRLPHIWKELWEELATAKQEIINSADREALRNVRELVREKNEREEEEGVVLTNGFRKRNVALNGIQTPDESVSNGNHQDELEPETLRQIWQRKSSTPSYQTMLRSRMQLPMWNFRDQVMETIDRQQVVIICGETGCGKSTQVPAFILEHELSKGKSCKVYCTEPRRISAISLAKRVSNELGERKNDIGTSRSLVGYAIRLEAQMTRETRLVYATTGIVMRMLERSTDLAEITHLVLDEVHERSIDSDFLLIVLRKLMLRRPELKVILMSATVDAQRFSNYLEGAPVLNVPGRTFPVRTKYLEDAIEMSGYELGDGTRQNGNTDPDDFDGDIEDMSGDTKSKADAAKTLKSYSSRTRKTLAVFDEYRIDYDFVSLLLQKIATEKEYIEFSRAILVFLPGIAEIRRMNDMLTGHPLFAKKWYIYPLHSTIASEDQEQAFLTPPRGVRKIVLATNIAETGITIPDVTCVVDTGKHKEMRFDERRQLSRLIEAFISRANAKQRRGRAGRVQEGLCFHLFTKARHDQIMAEQQTPEMLRLSLQDLVLRVKICKLGDIEETLSDALDAPQPKNIRRAIDSLVDVKALTAGEELTPLGRQLAKLPLDVHLGKLILLGCIFGCLDVALTVAAILSSKSPFQASIGSRVQADLARVSFKRGDSDLLTLWNAYCAWRRVCTSPGSSESQFCRKNFLSPQTLSNIEDLKSQLLVSVVDAGFVALDETQRAALNRARFHSSRSRNFISLPPSSTINNENDVTAASIITWAFYPKLLTRDGKGWRNVANNQSVSLHPTSVNKSSNVPKWLSYYHIMQSSNKFYNAHETTLADDFAIALLCGDAEFRLYAGVVVLDGNRVRFSVTEWETMLILKTLRARLKEIMARAFKSPEKALTSSQARWMAVWEKIFGRVWEIREKMARA